MNQTMLANELIGDEQMRLFAYDDATGKPFKQGDTLVGKLSIGCGRNLTDVGITREEAMVLMAANIAGTVVDLDRTLPWWRQLSDARQNVLANMCFNMGINRLLGFKKMLTFAQAGRFDASAAEMLDSKWAGQVHGRALRLAARMRTGEFA